MIKLLRLELLLNRIYFHKPEIERVLILSCLFGILLSFTRVVYTGQLLFLSLIWNLFLAFVPLCISKLMMNRPEWLVHKLKFVAGFLTWLLFIPNAFYIITDLFHLQERPEVPLWFDLVLIFTFAWNGLLLGVWSVRQMEKLFALRWRINENFFIYPVMFLNAFGIYLGRYLRYNSWDVVSNPFNLISDMVYLAAHPIRNRFDWSMIICFFILMVLLYVTIKKLSREVGEAAERT